MMSVCEFVTGHGFHNKVTPLGMSVGGTTVCSQKTDIGHGNEHFILLFIYISNPVYILNHFYYLDIR